MEERDGVGDVVMLDFRILYSQNIACPRSNTWQKGTRSHSVDSDPENGQEARVFTLYGSVPGYQPKGLVLAAGGDDRERAERAEVDYGVEREGRRV